MVVRAVEVITDDDSETSTQVMTSTVEVVENVSEVLESTAVKSGFVISVTGQNIVQNAVVSETAPVNPYEGQVWIDIS